MSTQAAHRVTQKGAHGVRAGLAWGICIFSVLLGLSSLVLSYLARPYPTPADSLPLFERLLIFLPTIVSLSIAGALIAIRQPRNVIGWLLLVGGVGDSLSGVVEGYWRYALFVQPGALPGGQVMLWLNTRLYTLTTINTLLFVLLFPTGRLLSQRWLSASWAIVLGSLLQFIGQAFAPGPLDPGVTITNPIALDGATGTIELITWIGTALTVGGALAAGTALLLRLKRAQGIERQQIKLVVYALAPYVISLVAVIYQVQASGGPFTSLTRLAFIVLGWAGVMVAGALAVAILRHHLFDIDVIINRTLVYSLLTGMLVAIYLGGVVLVQGLFRTLTGQESELAIVASTLAVAVCFQPLRSRIQAFIDRIFFRRKYDTAQVLGAYGLALRDDAELETLSTGLVRVADETMRPVHVALWLREREDEKQ